MLSTLGRRATGLEYLLIAQLHFSTNLCLHFYCCRSRGIVASFQHQWVQYGRGREAAEERTRAPPAGGAMPRVRRPSLRIPLQRAHM